MVEEALKYASLNTKFRVVVVDSRPRLEGRGLLKSLAEHGIQCTYVLLSAVSYVMKDVTKVILGAAAMMASGTALSRVGTAVVAMMAHTLRRPVIFCCETYKFGRRVQMDGIVSNEVADPSDLIKDKDGRATLLEGWEEVDHMGVLNLSYDLTPPGVHHCYRDGRRKHSHNVCPSDYPRVHRRGRSRRPVKKKIKKKKHSLSQHFFCKKFNLLSRHGETP